MFPAAYGIQVLHASSDFLLMSLTCGNLLSFVTIPLSGHLSDRFGRKRIYLIGAELTGIYTFVQFALLNTAQPIWIFVAIVLAFIPHDLMWGTQAALIAECFPPRLCYSGSSLDAQLASVIVTIVSTAMVPDYANRDISEERDKP